ncbi:MAG: phosphatidate cytidylyltransferase [Holophagaceae bacterium]|nr:phosphatidate cytidylyltransferase [Holophagaceae bacterium]
MSWSNLPEPLRYAILGVGSILVAASLLVASLAVLRPTKDFSELKLRVRTWWIMSAVFLGALAFNRIGILCFFAFLSFLALKEFLSMIPTRRADRRVLFWAYLAIPLQYLWIGMDWYGMFLVFIPVYMFLFLAMRTVLIQETDGFLKAVGTLHWGLMVSVYALSHGAWLALLKPTYGVHGGGLGLLLMLVFLTQFNDVSQYIWGRTLGRTPALPKVSPKKTLEGLLGGVATTVTLAVLLAPRFTLLTKSESLMAGLIIGFGGFIGDVVISAVKRDLHLKDSGQLLPGHGGILDRVDSLFFTTPLFFHFVKYLDRF